MSKRQCPQIVFFCVLTFRPDAPTSVSSPAATDSGDGLPQQEEGVVLPAQHALHLEGVWGGAGVVHHALPELGERSARHQLHPHWSNAAFGPEGPVDGRHLLETVVQLGTSTGTQ